MQRARRDVLLLYRSSQGGCIGGLPTQCSHSMPSSPRVDWIVTDPRQSGRHRTSCQAAWAWLYLSRQSRFSTQHSLRSNRWVRTSDRYVGVLAPINTAMDELQENEQYFFTQKTLDELEAFLDRCAPVCCLCNASPFLRSKSIERSKELIMQSVAEIERG